MKVSAMKNESLQRDILESLKGGQRWSFSLRMAPMIDMIFLLLLFFLVAARWRPEESFLPLRLPVARGERIEVGKVEPLMIRIHAVREGCEVEIGGCGRVRIEQADVEAELGMLLEQMRICMEAQKRFAGDPVEINCEGSVKWDAVAKIYNVFFGAGLSDITFRMTE